MFPATRLQTCIVHLIRNGKDHDWPAEKAYVAFGWNDRDDRTLIHFVEAAKVRARLPKNKEGVREIAAGHLTAIL